MKYTDSNVVLIREFFGDVRPVSMQEIKDLTPADREELGNAIRETLPQ